MKSLIIKYLSSSLSEVETKTLRDWLQQNSKNREEFMTIVRTNQELDFLCQSIDSEKAYRRILEETSSTHNRYLGKMSRNILKYAAVVVLLVGSTLMFHHFSKSKDSFEHKSGTGILDDHITLELEDGSIKVIEDNKQATITNGKGEAIANQEYDKIKYDNTKVSSAEDLVYNQLTVPFGKRFAVELADGTYVYLNAGTKFRYPISFSDPKSREVHLDGEAMFIVTENVAHPFIVHTEKMDVRVLGTKFNVTSYRNENNTSAVLVEGSVAVSKASEIIEEDKNVILTPSQQAVVEEEDITVQKVNVQKHIAWTTGKLYFVNDRFENIIRKLERHFNIKIQNHYQELNQTRYTGTFESESIEQILNTFKKNSHFDYTKKDGQIIIEPSSDIKK